MSGPSSNSPKDQRRLRGFAAEQAVESYLVDRGYEILARDLRVGRLEIDLVAKKADLVAIVEVRFRGPASWQGPFESMTRTKRDHVVQAGRLLWHQRFENDLSVNRMRFDAASVVLAADGSFRIEYAEGAWQAD